MKKYRTAKAFRVLLTTTTALIALAATPALADADNPSSSDKDNNGLENIIVTANKRAENVQTVPTAVTAISAEQLKEMGVTNALDIAQFTPGVQVMAVNSGTTNFFSIRGATEDDFAEHEESPVAVYIDGVYMSTASGTSALLFDTERVEVLRGPQGTLFGRNATAGAVQYISKGPTDTPDGYFETSYGNYNQNHTEGAFSDAIAPNLSFRLSLANDYMDPWQHNAFYDGRYDSGNNNNHAGRFQLLYKPTEDFDATLNLHGSNLNVRAGLYKYGNVTTDPNNHGLTVFAGSNNGDSLPDPLGYCQNCSYPGSNYYTSAAEVLGHNRTDMVGATATLHYRFDGLTLTSISDVTHYTKNYSEDSESSPYPSQQFWTGVNTQQYSEEIHLENDSDERLRWVAGLYYLQMDGRFEQGSGSASGTDIPNAGPNGFGEEDLYTDFTYTPASCPSQFTCQGTDERYRINTRSWSEFAQAEYDITKDLTFTAGGRWATDTRTLSYDVWGSNSPYAWGPYVAGPPLLSISPSGQYCLGGPCTDGNGNSLALNGNPKLLKSDWSGKVALNYKVTDDIMPYISWSRGIKAGGFSTVSSPQLIAAGAYKYGEEKVYDTEAGIKSEFFDHRLRVNADIFYYDYVGYQAFNTVETAYGQQSFISNNNAKMRGGELEVSARPIPGLTIHQGLAILDADLDDIEAPDGTVRDVHPVQAPRANYTGQIDYTWTLPGSIGAVIFGADYSWRSTYFYDVQNDPAARQGAFWLLNLHAEYTTEDGQWSIKGYGSNVTGTQYLTNVIASAPFYQGVWGAPSMYGVRLSYHL
jgi:iron complex outermembrane receptor protein